MAELKPCPFCGSHNVNFDTINGRAGQTLALKMQCKNCVAGTAWFDTGQQAVEAWNMRDAESAAQTTWDKRFDPPKDRMINEDLFTLDEATYARNPETGNCYIHPWRGDQKSKRISRKVFLEMYQSCEKKIAEEKQSARR